MGRHTAKKWMVDFYKMDQLEEDSQGQFQFVKAAILNERLDGFL